MRVVCIVSVALPFALLNGCGGGGSATVVPTATNATSTPGPTFTAQATPTAQPTPTAQATPTGTGTIPAFTPIPLSSGSWQAARFQEAVGSIPYQLYVPPTSAGEQLPLVLFFHGAGQAGTDGVHQLDIHLTRVFVFPRNQAIHPCFFVAPQAPQGIPGGDGTWSGLDWTAPTNTQRPTPTVPMQLTLDLVRDLKNRFPAIDPARIYVTGTSMGGFGVWDASTREPQTFAAAVPICGGGDPSTAARVVSLPLWAWHDTTDPIISVDRTRQMIAALRAAGGQPIYTETTGYGHSEWNAAYADKTMLSWLFEQKRP